MGVYDFFKGQCPNCEKQIDEHPKFGKCGDIQTKYFVGCHEYECFRDFYPGDMMPFSSHENLIIGRTCCCQCIIKACFQQDILLEYAVVVGHEKFLYLQKEMYNTFDIKYMPQRDKDWYFHFQKQQHILPYIIQAAFHPQRLKYYLSQGYSLDDITSF